MGRPRKTNFQNENEQLNSGVKTDCFAFRKNIVNPELSDCRCLTDLYCRGGCKCNFYKTKYEIKCAAYRRLKFNSKGE